MKMEIEDILVRVFAGYHGVGKYLQVKIIRKQEGGWWVHVPGNITFYEDLPYLTEFEKCIADHANVVGEVSDYDLKNRQP